MGAASVDYKQTVQRHKKIRKSLLEVKQPWMDVCRVAVDELLPGYEQYLATNQSGGKSRPGRYKHIVDHTGPQALRLATAGLQSGLTSPARPWFALGSFDPDKAKWGRYREWYQMSSRVIFRTLSFTNFYDTARRVYEGELGFGTVVVVVEPDWQKIVRYTPLCIGEFCIIVDAGQVPCGLYHDIWLTAEQTIKRFGMQAVSTKIKEAYRNNDQRMFLIHHVVVQNEQRNWLMLDNRNAPWSSIYFEENADDEEKVLSHSGFFNRPFIAPRWDAAGRNAYGEAQSFMLLGQLGLLRQMNLGQIKGIHMQLEPPMVAPKSWDKKRTNRLPGGWTFLDVDKGHVGPLYTVNPDINGVTLGINDRREMIRQGFFNDLLFAISRNKIETATEAMQLYEEQILMLSPQIERQFFDFLDPALDITMEIMAARKLLPMAPMEIQGDPINVEYTSRLAQAQQMAWTKPLEQTYQFFKALSETNADVMDIYNHDAAAREYADLAGCPYTVINDPDATATIRQQRMQGLAQQARREQGMQRIAAMKGLSEIPVDRDGTTALQAINEEDAA